MILITTAGKVGSEAARILAERGVPVRVLVRDRQRANALALAGAEVVEGDLTAPETVDAAMHGVSGVVLVSPAIPAQEIAVIDSAVRAGAGHVVKVTSDSSATSPIARRRGQAEIEDALIASGLSYTLLKNNAYMQNFLMLAPAIAATDSFTAAAEDGRIGMIDARDVAAIAAEIATAPADHAKKIYWPTGPETLSYADAAAVLSKVLDRRITYRSISVEQQRQAMIDLGLPAPVADDNAKALGLFAEGDADYLTDDLPTILGRPGRPFQQFVTEFATAFA
ncbi:NmrA family NAD(P)-binding protein [Nocardia sp. CA2R105]|uniref:NmrA family NAD(P)-binding protein n=1 Tax=Nocardia coffeae TaxID=2873381 RepID=UPI001CA5FA52|nr:NmrA family NAD(P)-binding protein [Nocardia coffeae]MBY8855376.1 NmrA family NAD(P)-binding protein [Nocardia coffeae]